ncbi:hypothetical protein [Helicobacter sp. 11S03491-1]|uniref:hypothetical protein n=1 Tax=Helicobacter sp. 11S03491-1 TaxID=1476196 RepID=UPI0015DB70F3|nr:hypothetical protein [Helicobacter sp. 11S03491-1]
MNEAENVKNRNTQTDFVSLFEEELRKFVEDQDIQNNVENKEIEVSNSQPLEPVVEQNQIQEFQTESLKTFTLPINWENFQFNMDIIANKLLENNQKELKKLNLYKEQEFLRTPIGIYARNNLFSEEKIKEFQTQYAKSYLKKLSKEIKIELRFLGFNANNNIILQCKSDLSQNNFLDLIKNAKKDYFIDSEELHWNFDIKDVQKFHQESKDFIETFQDELKDFSQTNLTQEINENSSESPILKANTQAFSTLNHQQNQDNLKKPQYSNLLDFFEKKRIENQNMAISKDEFKKDFLVYCKNNMNENEMQILINLYNKEPTKLTKEHKDMLEKGMRYNLINNNLLDKELENSIKQTLGIPIERDHKKTLNSEKNLNQEVQKVKNQEIKEVAKPQKLNNTTPNTTTIEAKNILNTTKNKTLKRR